MSDYIRQHATVTTQFTIENSWVVLSSIEQNIKLKIEKLGRPLKDWNIQINYGIKTGFNEAFIIDEKTRLKLIEKSPKNAEIIRPILLGRNIKQYAYDWEGFWLINAHNGVKSKGIAPINIEKNYPLIFQYLKQYQPQLEKRLDKGNHWTNLRNCAYIEDFEKPKIAWGNLALQSQFSFVSSEYIINAPSPFFATENLYLLAILNSKIGDFYIKQLGVSRSGGYFEYKPMFVEKVPIPNINLKEQIFFKNLVNEIISKKKNNTEIELTKNKINTMVYDLYGLNEDERILCSK
jgi:adenine-specific DNA-methyltransferase